MNKGGQVGREADALMVTVALQDLSSCLAGRTRPIVSNAVMAINGVGGTGAMVCMCGAAPGIKRRWREGEAEHTAYTYTDS